MTDRDRRISGRAVQVLRYVDVMEAVGGIEPSPMTAGHRQAAH
jgi:hypothetical protein